MRNDFSVAPGLYACEAPFIGPDSASGFSSRRQDLELENPATKIRALVMFAFPKIPS